MDLLHAGAYSSTPVNGDDDGVPANELQGHYLDHATNTKNYSYRDSSEENDSSDEQPYDNPVPQPDTNLSKRTEIEEADRIVLPSILTSDEKLDWTLRFVSVSKELRRKEAYPFVSRTILKLAALERDFLQTAKLYAKIIIDEKFLPNEKKTIKPANMGGIAGGLKYFQEGILFKFALDSHGLYGGDVNAMKSAGHEMKCIVALFKRLKPDYFVPMVGVIDYKGFRIIAISLLPIKGSTLIYGSNDGGRTFNSSDPVVNNDMNELGASLNLQAHTVCKDKVIRTPADLEVHKGTDGLYYLVDVARLWPPEPPSVKGSFLYRLLREEFVTAYKRPLSSDAFSGFANSDPMGKEHNADIREAFEFYVNQFVPAVAQELLQLSVAGTELQTYLHSRGINFRHMGLLWQHLPQFSPWRRVVMSEIVTRAAKSVLRSLMRRSIERFGVHNNEPFLKLIASYFNLLLGTSEDSTAYWHNELFRTVRDSFFYITKQDEDLDESVRLRDLIDEQKVFTKLLRDFGVQLKESFWKSFSFQLVFNQPTFVEETDIESITPVIKQSDLGRFALPIYLIDKAECKLKSEETTKVHKEALTMLLDTSLANHGNIFLTFRYTCRALVTQPIDATLTNLARLSNITNQIWKLLETSEEDYKLSLKYFLQDLGTLLVYIYVSPSRVPYTPAMTTYLYDIFNPYFIAISFMKNKDVLKKRSVLSEDLFKDIEELDLQSTRGFWSEMFANTLAKLPNLKALNFSRSLITPTIMSSLDQTNLKLEKIVLPDTYNGAVELSQYKQFMKTHPELKEVILEVNNATELLPTVTHPDLESFECSTKTFANTFNTGEIDAKSLAWLKERKNLKKLRVNNLSVKDDFTNQFVSAMPQIEDLTITSLIEPLEPVLALKNLTRLDLSQNRLDQQKVVINAPLKLKQFIMRSSQCAPAIITTIVKNSPDLEFVSMRYSMFNDECCQALLHCPKLEVLRVKQAAVTAEGMKSIGQCKSLKQLTLGDKDRAIDDAAITHLAPILPNLEVLDLFMFEKLSDNSVSTILTVCKKLQKLKLPPSISDKAFEVTNHASKQTLTYLNILMTKVTDAGMEIIISNYPNMKVLKAPWAITVNTFKRFYNWTNLRRVVVHETIPDLKLGLNVWSLTINTATESRVVFAELLPRSNPITNLTLVGCLGGATVSFPPNVINVNMAAKLLQMDL